MADETIAIRRLTSVDFQAIFNELKFVHSELKVNWKNLLSVCFDGVAAMSGSVSGVQMRCKELNSNIVYVHCYAHCLNLVLVDAWSCSRHTTFEKISNEIGSTLRTLKYLSTTRWTYFTEIIETTKQIDVKVNGIGLLHQVKSFNFIFGLTMMHPILQLIVKVKMRGFLIIFKEAKNVCIELEIDIPLVKKTEDNMVTSLDLRFQQETIKIINAVGNILNLKLNKEEVAVLEEKFKISQDELMAEIRLLKADKAVLTGNSATTLIAHCERAFSKLTQVKTKLRSTTKQDRLESLMLLYVEQELTANVEASEVIESIVPFQRRLLL
ncbi:zinc finger MYM-type protein 1-like [Aphis craccivora]|uniref:Zinc finger MYM-type protein 1-like n=1 Tax=Aphis craccivora TaxID=307492 RepID=A0A6G0XTA1_APHCR|nr:zinc finger MYM-type protein 1-like [Aphis craccivora]